MSLSALAELVEQVDIAPDAGELRTGFAVRDRLDAKLTVAVGRFEANGGHEVDGALSIQAWLTGEAGRDRRTAGRLAFWARKLRQLPVVTRAALEGSLTGGQLEAIAANVALRHLERFAEHEADIVPTLIGLGPDDTRRAMEHWRRHADALVEGKEPPAHDSEVHLSKTLDARGELRGSLNADDTAVVEAALRVADSKDRDTPPAVRRAEALAQVCQHFLDHQQTRKGGRRRPHLNVAIEYDELLQGVGGVYVDTGQPVSPEALGALLCDCALHRLLFRGLSGILNYGRATRTWPVDLSNAIAIRDGGCRFPGCDAPPSWCDIHHVQPWEAGGDTSIDDGVVGCRRHHRLFHRTGYSVKLLPDGTFEVTFPDGTTKTSRPRGPASPSLFRRRPTDGS